MQIDYTYMCEGLGRLTGLEVRIYKDGHTLERNAPMAFEPDLATLILSKIEGRKENAFFLESDELLLFGVVRIGTNGTTLVLGPTAQIRPGENSVLATLYSLGEAHSRLAELLKYFEYMIPYPFENFLAILCFINYAINDEKLSVGDLIKDSYRLPPVHITATAPQETEDMQGNPHNTYTVEREMLSYVRTGNVQAIEQFFIRPPSGRGGSLAHNSLRQHKNIFICAATLISRAAVEGGMAADFAFAISDVYIQKVELLQSASGITALSMEMLLDYTNRVAALKCGSETSRLAQEVLQYVHKNIGCRISTTDIAKALGMNRTYLCERFHAETGKTLVEFITLSKIDEAKRMLRTTKLTIAQISDCLAFSSQSYFQTVFKKAAGCTPKAYRTLGE